MIIACIETETLKVYCPTIRTWGRVYVHSILFKNLEARQVKKKY
jgi:hypothetical protein